MTVKANLISAWFDKGDKDILTAEHEVSFKDAVFESVCFHCQQGVEKYIKGYLVFLDVEYTKTHEIGELITICERKDPDIGRFKIEADKLTDYAVEIRYPDDWYEPTKEESQEALQITKHIRDYILNKVRMRSG